jgi:hypothetical protein
MASSGCESSPSGTCFESSARRMPHLTPDPCVFTLLGLTNHHLDARNAVAGLIRVYKQERSPAAITPLCSQYIQSALAVTSLMGVLPPTHVDAGGRASSPTESGCKSPPCRPLRTARCPCRLQSAAHTCKTSLHRPQGIPPCGQADNLTPNAACGSFSPELRALRPPATPLRTPSDNDTRRRISPAARCSPRSPRAARRAPAAVA